MLHPGGGGPSEIARAHAVPEPLVREACLLHRLPTTAPAYWQGWNRLRARMGAKFRALVAAVSQAMANTPRSSSLVENLNSRLRTYFTLRRHLGGAYLELLRFVLNHRHFLRSRHAERRGKSPRELLTGQAHPHWLTLLGLGKRCSATLGGLLEALKRRDAGGPTRDIVKSFNVSRGTIRACRT